MLQEKFPQNLDDVSLGDFYRAINKVVPSLIRTDADEVTYNLHVLIRFSLELDILEGNLSIADLPKTWNDRYEEYLGFRPPNDVVGVMQDVHWFMGPIGGGFQGYTLGNIFSGLIYSAALSEHPAIPAEIENGEFDTLRNWLCENIYQYGSKYSPIELLSRLSDNPLSIDPYINYLRAKYEKIYNL
jgi:carboxypeptidase Taq